MSVRAMRQHLDEARKIMEDLRDAFAQQYWYAHPEREGADVVCHLCGFTGRRHIGTSNGYLCPVQPDRLQELRQIATADTWAIDPAYADEREELARLEKAAGSDQGREEIRADDCRES